LGDILHLPNSFDKSVGSSEMWRAVHHIRVYREVLPQVGRLAVLSGTAPVSWEVEWSCFLWAGHGVSPLCLSPLQKAGPLGGLSREGELLKFPGHHSWGPGTLA
jgi:hypothetical protein